MVTGNIERAGDARAEGVGAGVDRIRPAGFETVAVRAGAAGLAQFAPGSATAFQVAAFAPGAISATQTANRIGTTLPPATVFFTGRTQSVGPAVFSDPTAGRTLAPAAVVPAFLAIAIRHALTLPIDITDLIRGAPRAAKVITSVRSALFVRAVGNTSSLALAGVQITLLAGIGAVIAAAAPAAVVPAAQTGAVRQARYTLASTRITMRSRLPAIGIGVASI